MTSERRHYQRQVETLLETIRHGVEELERLRARGLRGRALAAPQAELSAARRALAELVSARERRSGPASPPIAADVSTERAPKRRRPAPAWTPALR